MKSAYLDRLVASTSLPLYLTVMYVLPCSPVKNGVREQSGPPQVTLLAERGLPCCRAAPCGQRDGRFRTPCVLVAKRPKKAVCEINTEFAGAWRFRRLPPIQ